MTIKILDWNVRVWWKDLLPSKQHFWLYRANRIRKIIETEQPDIICLQEAIFPMTLFLVPSNYKRTYKWSISNHIYYRSDLPITVLKSKWRPFALLSLLNIRGYLLNLKTIHSHWSTSAFRKALDTIKEDTVRNLKAGEMIVGTWNRNKFDVYKNIYRSGWVMWGLQDHTFTNWKDHRRGCIDCIATRDIKDLQYEVVPIAETTMESDHNYITLTFEAQPVYVAKI